MGRWVELEQYDGLHHVRIDQVGGRLKGPGPTATSFGRCNRDEAVAILVDVVEAFAAELLLVELAELVEKVGEGLGQCDRFGGDCLGRASCSLLLG